MGTPDDSRTRAGKADNGVHGNSGSATDRPALRRPLLHQASTEIVIAGFYRVYNALGHGFVESVYANALANELAALGATVEREVLLQVYYEGHEVGRFRADQIVDHVVLVETKAAEHRTGAHEKQVLNYLRATKLQVALLLNFGPKPTFRRLVMTNDRKNIP